MHRQTHLRAADRSIGDHEIAPPMVSGPADLVPQETPGDPFVHDAIDLIPIGVILVDAACQVVRANPSAMRILLEGSGLWEDEQGLTTLDPVQTRKIRTAAAARSAVCLSLSRGPQKRALALRVVPLRNGTSLSGRATAACFLSDGEQEITVAPETLAELYGLTPSESAIVSRLLQGWEVREIARERGVQENTIRSHLKSVFARTRTRSQADLVRLLLTGPAALRGS